MGGHGICRAHPVLVRCVTETPQNVFSVVLCCMTEAAARSAATASAAAAAAAASASTAASVPAAASVSAAAFCVNAAAGNHCRRRFCCYC